MKDSPRFALTIQDEEVRAASLAFGESVRGF
jgi:hypothetical protein